MSVVEMTRRAILSHSAALAVVRSGEASSSTFPNTIAPPARDDEQNSSETNALASAARTIVAYIPTEIVTIYVAAVAAADIPGKQPAGGQWVLFWIFLVLTPIIVWGTYALAMKENRRGRPWRFRQWPATSMALATLSFTLWAFSLPKSPFGGFSWYRPSIGSVALLVGTLIIGTIASLAEPPATQAKSSR